MTTSQHYQDKSGGQDMTTREVAEIKADLAAIRADSAHFIDANKAIRQHLHGLGNSMQAALGRIEIAAEAIKDMKPKIEQVVAMNIQIQNLGENQKALLTRIEMSEKRAEERMISHEARTTELEALKNRGLGWFAAMTTFAGIVAAAVMELGKAIFGK